MQYFIRSLNESYSFQKFLILFVAAFLLRALSFGGYVQFEERYKQADTMDYYNCGLCMKYTHSMSYPSGQPIFWRTPGYPWYLSFFYTLYGNGTEFAQNEKAHKASIWFQIFLCSFIPILIFFLAFTLTGIHWISWLAAWISVVHIGFILSTNYILSDALAMIPFILFLIYLYKSFCLIWENCQLDQRSMIINAALAAFYLALFTWIRPNGQFVIAVAAILILFGACIWRMKSIKLLTMFLIFFLMLFPWYLRNYRLTGEWVYCPMSGPVLQSFCVPKIDRYLTGRTFEECWKDAMRLVGVELRKEALRLQREEPGHYLSKELVCKKLAHPRIMEHPFVFAWEWIKESLKTTFDLYGSQLANMANKTHTYDPLEEFLGEKLEQALYKQPLSFGMRFLIWLEFLWALFKWLGLFAGCWLFLIRPLIKRFEVSPYEKKMFFVWLKVSFMAGSLLAMTGGFGYARLRLPIDPLLIILTLTFWYWVSLNWQKKKLL